MTTIKTLMLAILTALVTNACGDVPTSPSGNLATQTFLSFVSPPGDAIGNGVSRHFVLGDGVWFARFDRQVRSEHLVVSLRVGGTPIVTPQIGPSLPFVPGSFSPFPVSSFTLHLAAPLGRALDVGTFEFARRWPFQGPDQPGLDFSGEGRACKTLTGRFLIHQMVLGPKNMVDRLHVTFEQNCEGVSAALKGEVGIVSEPWR